jgi:hypothetical protein
MRMSCGEKIGALALARPGFMEERRDLGKFSGARRLLF